MTTLPISESCSWPDVCSVRQTLLCTDFSSDKEITDRIHVCCTGYIVFSRAVSLTYIPLSRGIATYNS